MSSESALSELTTSDVESVGSGSYATTLPSGVENTPGSSFLFSTDNVAPPYPTNGWWQRELVGTANWTSDPYAYGAGVINAVPTMAVSKGDGDGFRSFYAKEWSGDPSAAGNVSLDYGTSPGLDVGHAATDSLDGSYVDGYGDWHVRVKYGSGTPNLTATFVKGSAFTFCEYEGGEAEISLVEYAGQDQGQIETTADNGTVWYHDGNVLGISVTANGQQKDYGVFAPTGVTFDGVSDGSLSTLPITTSGLQANGGYLTVAPMPDTSASTIQRFEQYAYNFVTDTTVDWNYVQSDASGNPASEVRTTFDYTLEQKAESTTSGTLAWLFPHQWKYTDATLTGDTLFSAKGTLKLWAGTSFQTTKTYPGILPMMPGSVLDSEAQSNVTSYVDQLIADSSSSGSGPYSVWSPPAQTYWVAKGLYRNTVAAPLAEQHASDGTNAGIFLEAVRKRLENWFDATSTSFTIDGTTYSSTESGASRELFYYNTILGTLLGYPSGEFGLATSMNDHHFHWGYFVYAASEVARQNPSWADKYGDMVELLIRDYANWERPANDGDPSTATTAIDATTPKNAPKDAFPFMRNFDAYAGHSWAGGFASWNGNNQESSSEAVNAYAAMIRWGEITGNDAIRDAGVFLYTQEIHAVWEYWFDSADDSHPDNWGADVTDSQFAPTGSAFETATKVRGIGYDRSIFWSASDPVEHFGINWIPTGGHSFYLGREREYANANWQSLIDAREQWGISNPESDFLGGWKAAAWSYRALSKPGEAVSLADGVMTDGDPLLKDGGNSGAAGYQFVHALDAMGTPDDVVADTTFYQTFSDGTERTYVVYNAGDTQTTVTFSDGYSMTVAANAIAAESSSANYAADTTAPEQPPNLTVESTSYESIDLSWDPITDEESGLFYYDVRVDGTTVEETLDPAITLTGLSADTSYDIAVSAVDLGGNESSAATTTATTDSLDTAVPSTPSGLFAVEWTASSVELVWDAADAPEFGVDHYNVYVDGTKQTEATTTRATVTGLSGEVQIVVSAVNGAPASNESAKTDPITVALSDPGANEPYFGTPKPLPGRLELEYYDRGGTNVAYRDRTAGQGQYAGALRTEQSVGIGADAPTGYNIAYTAADEWVEYTVSIEQAGTYEVVGSYANGGTSAGGPISVRIDGEPVGDAFTIPTTGSWTTFEQGSLGSVDLPAGEHVIRLYFEDGGFNLDWLEFRAGSGDTTAPSAPATLSADAGESSVALSWDAASDGESSVFRYHVFQDGSEVAATTDTAATVEGLTSGTEYTFGVAAEDAFGNVSERATTTVTTELPNQDTRAPTPPSNVRQINTTKTSIDLGWDPASDNVGVDHYTVSLDGSVVAETDRRWVTLDDLDTATAYEVQITATDAAGNESDPMTTTVVTADRTGQAPLTAAFSVPGVVEAEAFDTGGSGVSYNETTAGNENNIRYGSGIEYRSDTSVDFGGSGDYNVGWPAKGEWLEYTIEVPATGHYDITYYAAAGAGGGGTLSLSVDGIDVSGERSVPQTGGYTTFQPLGPVRAVPLTEGTHVLRVNFASGGFNLEQFEITPSVGTPIDRSNWSVSASDYAVGSGWKTPPERAIDGDAGTEWASGVTFAAKTTTFTVDMGERRDLGSVVVEHTGDAQAPSTMDVQVSTDGSNWTTATTVEGSATTIADLGGATGQYVRLVERDESSTKWWKITDLHVMEALPDLASDDSAPAAPTGLTVDSTTDTQVSLSWDAVESDRHHYAVSVDGTQRRTTASPSAVVGDLRPGETYTIGVTAVDAAGNESEAATTTVETTAAVEYSLTVTEASASTLEVRFQPSSPVTDPTLVLGSEDERTVEMTETDAGWRAVVGDLDAGTTVEYHVEYGRAGQRLRTDRASHEFAGERPPAPSDLEVAERGPTSVTLTWSADEIEGATEFVVTEAGTEVARVPADQTQAQITGLAPATTHAFAVSATIEGESTPTSSAVHTVRTAPYSLAQSRQIATAWYTGRSVGDVPLAGDTVDYETVRAAAADRGGEDE